MLRLHTQTRKIDTVFIVCLFMLFAMTSCILILIGAKQYHTTADAMNHNYEVRTVSSYLTEKVHQYDTSTGIAITDFAGGHALALSNTAEEQTYITYIYYYDGALRELLLEKRPSSPRNPASPSSRLTALMWNRFTPD